MVVRTKSKGTIDLQEVIDFFELEEGFDKNEVIDSFMSEIKELQNYSADEIVLECDSKKLMVLQDFAEQFYDKLIDGVCNVIKSFDE